MTKIKKIGILGGTFDPPHLGHLKMARLALKKLKLDKVIFMLSARPPLKEERRKVTSIKVRFKMLQILIRGEPKFETSDLEIKRAGRAKSYTIDTICELKRIYPKDTLYWLIGEDSFKELLQEKWKDSKKIFDLINVIVFSRPGYQVKKMPKWAKIKRVKMSVAISSTRIREDLKKGVKVDKLLPKGVLSYIMKNKLYQK